MRYANTPRTPFPRSGPALLLLLALAISAAPVCAQEEVPTEEARNPAQVSLFHEHADQYKGGRQLPVTVHISATRWDEITAMGLYETVPAGWTYGGARSIAGPMPGVMPSSGASGVLQFLWIEQSQSPIVFQYTLNIPPQDSGARFLSGQVEYRRGEGALTSNVAFSQLDGIADAAPVITLRGSAAMSVLLNGSFADPGATATDAEDGDLSGQISVVGNVDTTSPGTYTLVYGVMDSVGNRAEPVFREVLVEEELVEPGGAASGNPNSNGAGGASTNGGSDADHGTPRRVAAAKTPTASPGGPAIAIPEVSIQGNSPDFKLPMKSDDTGDELARDGGGVGPETDEAFRLASAAERAVATGADSRDASTMPGDSPSDRTRGAQSPIVLIAVFVVLMVTLPILWRSMHRAGGRRR